MKSKGCIFSRFAPEGLFPQFAPKGKVPRGPSIVSFSRFTGHPRSVLGPGDRGLPLVLGVAVLNGQELVIGRLPSMFVDLEGDVVVAIMVYLHPPPANSHVLMAGLFLERDILIKNEVD